MDSSAPAVTFTQVGSVGVAQIDSPPVNALNLAVRTGLAAALSRAQADPGIASLLIVSVGRIFTGGADIAELGGPARSPTLQELEGQLERAPLPIVVAIQGMALGGGLELAMACHYRIAAADARLGLPEVTLGLMPGAGGTQRLPRLIGAKDALDMILSGMPITAAQAATRGLIDEVAAGDLRPAALAFCERLRVQQRGPRPTRALPVAGRLDQAASLPFDQGIAVEERLAQQSLAARESQALRHLFFAERAASKVAGVPDPASVPRIGRVAIIGAGTMGSGIALACADAGLSVTLIDNTPAALERGQAAIATNYASSVQRGRIDQETADLRRGRINPSTTLDAAAGADVVIEAVFEDLDVKQQLLATLDAIVPQAQLIASNTSTLSVTELARSAAHPQRVSDLGGTDVGTKARIQLYRRASRPDPYFVIADQLTALGRLGQKSGAGFYRYEPGRREALPDPQVTALIEKLAADRGIARRAIDAAEIVERCVLSLIHVGAMVLEEGVAARAADIDVVWTSGYGFPRYLGGPMFHADTLGVAHVAERIRHYHERDGHHWRPTALIEQLAAAGKTFAQWDQERQ